ncbi:MAG: hypothetical protein AAGL10_15520 [Pseudomonadota bacterium]
MMGWINHQASRLVAGALGAVILGGCAFSPQLSRVAIDHNRMVAQSADELTLLNIVRASRRYPLHFTTVTEVQGNARIALNAGVGTTLSPGSDPVSADIGAGVSTNPNFRATVLATDEFQRGIQAPIPSELVAYYLDAGWRDEQLMALMVERVEVYASPLDTVPAFNIVNDEFRESDFAKLLCTHGLVSEPTSSSVPLAQFSALIDTAKVASSQTSISERRKEITELLKLISNDGVKLTGGTLVIEGSTNSVRIAKLDKARCDGAVADPKLAQYTLRPRFRSTLGLIYFLGEYVRLSDEQGPDAVYQVPSCYDDCSPDRLLTRPVIDLRKGSGDALIETEFRGARYFIEAGEEQADPLSGEARARSLQVVALVQQLVNLQKSADTLPASLSITGVN